MIKHIVFWTVKDSAENGNKAAAIEKIVAVLAPCKDIPGVVEFEVATKKEGFECTYDVALYSVFTDKAALDGYQVHPLHEPAKQYIGSVRESRQCMDYAV